MEQLVGRFLSYNFRSNRAATALGAQATSGRVVGAFEIHVGGVGGGGGGRGRRVKRGGRGWCYQIRDVGNLGGVSIQGEGEGGGFASV